MADFEGRNNSLGESAKQTAQTAKKATDVAKKTKQVAEKAKKAKKAANAAKTVAKTTGKAAAQNYVGAAVEVAKGFGKEIVIGFFALIILLGALFVSGPRIVFEGLIEDVKEQITEWKFDAIKNKTSELLLDTYYDDYKNLISVAKKGYFGENPENIIKNIKDDKYVDVKDGYCDFVYNNSEGNDVLLFKTYGEPSSNERFARGLRIRDGTNPPKTYIDILSIVLAYSVWHRTNDLGSDNEYTEPESEEKRWNEVGYFGIKKFVKKHKEELCGIDLYDTEEVLKFKHDGTTYEYNAHILNFDIRSPDKKTIMKVFDLSEEDWEEVEFYKELAKELYEDSPASAWFVNHNQLFTSGDRQDKLVEIAKSKEGTGQSNTCTAWVRECYEEATGETATRYYDAVEAEQKCGGMDLPKTHEFLPTGCCIFTGYQKGYTNGHIGIYGGDGYVYHNLSGVKTVDKYEDYIVKYKATSWGWFNNDDLRFKTDSEQGE